MVLVILSCSAILLTFGINGGELQNKKMFLASSSFLGEESVYQETGNQSDYQYDYQYETRNGSFWEEEAPPDGSDELAKTTEATPEPAKPTGIVATFLNWLAKITNNWIVRS